ncbi:glycosyltransferase [Jeotgalibacillus proteolyticus]|uniref:Glycosyltransferase n=1 Tax=Jeotgalibacillus proteolyticus TaxID=2082395 RepID=A0A2S5G8C1_9BACL|nr:glycosyltransferase [Jeotgalibacillus proteolyticus]PPA69229.1 glycosyltransferase [Jeotgalibacillus proteolyticus]
MKKTVLFVIDSLGSGGAEKSLSSLLSLFDYDKYNVDLLMFSQNGLYVSSLPKEVNILETPNLISYFREDFKSLLLNKKFKEIYLKAGLSLALRNPILKDRFHSAQQNWKWLSKGFKKLDKKYDTAIAYSQGVPTYFVADKIKAFKKICWINTDYKLAGYNKSFDKEFYKKFDQIVAVSEGNKEIFLKEMPFTKEKVSVINDILSFELINELSNNSNGFLDDFNGTRILTIGRLVEVKGYDLAIKACFFLKTNGYNIKWYAIGEGILQKQLEVLIKEYGLQDTFILLGTHPNPYNYIKNSDIYVQSSRFEGFGLAIAEARLLNIPIVTTNFGGVNSQIVNEKNGLVVDMNAEAISAGVLKLINDEQLRKNIIKNLKFEKKGNTEEIEKIYRLIG